MARRLVIPERVKIRGKWWPVVRGVDLDGDSCPGHPKDVTTYDGMVADETIYLSHKIIGKRAERVAFLHELLHAVSTPGILTPVQEEDFIEDLDKALLTVLENLKWE